MPIYKSKRGKSKKSSKLKQYNVNNKLIADWFNYKNANSFNGSKAKMDILNGINDLIYHIEYELSKR